MAIQDDINAVNPAKPIDFSATQRPSLGSVRKNFLLIKSVLQALLNGLSGKQDAISLTTTGSSGAASLVGNTLNIPIYTSGTSGGSGCNPMIAAMKWYHRTGNPVPITISGAVPFKCIFDGTNVWVLSNGGGSYGAWLSRVNVYTNVVSNYTVTGFTSSLPTDMVFDGKYIYVCAGFGPTITKINAITGVGSTFTGSFGSIGGDRFVAMCWTGKHLWVGVNNYNNTVFGLGRTAIGSDGNGSGSSLGFSLPYKPYAIICDGTYLWVSLTSVTNNLLKIDLDSGAILATYTIPVGSSPIDVLNLAYDGNGAIWASTSSTVPMSVISCADGSTLATVTSPTGLSGELLFDGTEMLMFSDSTMCRFSIATHSLITTSSTGSVAISSPVFDGRRIWGVKAGGDANTVYMV